MTLTVQEWLRAAYWGSRLGFKEDKVRREWTVEGDTLEDCFKKVYAAERSNRYCNDRYLKIVPALMDDAYREWRKTGVTFQMFYGNATVD